MAAAWITSLGLGFRKDNLYETVKNQIASGSGGVLSSRISAARACST
jgi:hypothetical protein